MFKLLFKLPFFIIKCLFTYVYCLGYYVTIAGNPKKHNAMIGNPAYTFMRIMNWLVCSVIFALLTM